MNFLLSNQPNKTRIREISRRPNVLSLQTTRKNLLHQQKSNNEKRNSERSSLNYTTRIYIEIKNIHV